eukprot:gnl/TRDRNA2_/TRDRNA2_41961_c0_seq1.p1 gnl/TRDRNA2_/TRDRNA2_41961_c0~~gnl/TRDRNA2_/TRDRNA2_41961_c0_seq1.p1  ORF type:complete len:386 (+),score=105.28 gnl/TRDRNA2_/TRDRNA2_41961_c0_seq1:40-1158(+)
MSAAPFRRLARIAAAVAPSEVAGPVRLVPVATAAKAKKKPSKISSFVLEEGQAFARWAGVKVVLLGPWSGRGVPLAEKSQVEEAFTSRGMKVVFVDSEKDIPVDTTVLVTTGAAVGAEVIKRCEKLELVAVAFTGYDHVDMKACEARGITVVNVPGYSTDATAELTIALVLSHLRRLSECQQQIQDGSWNSPAQEDLQTKTVGIVGTGKIGMRLTELFKAFKVKSVLGFSQEEDSEFAAKGGEYVETLAALFLEADIICICVPLTSETKGLISAKLLALLSPSDLLVNIARGGVVDQAALADGLQAGRFRAALDVFDIEPLPKEDPLRKVSKEHLLMTPHIGYQSEMSLGKRYDTTVKNILAFLAGQPVNVV